MQLDIVKDQAVFKGLREEWDRVLEESRSRSIFLTWEWLYHWWLHFAGNRELQVMLFRDGMTKRLCGVAPFCREEQPLFPGVNVRKLRFLGTERVGSDFLDFIILPGNEEAVVATLAEYLDVQRGEWDVIELSDIDQRSATPDVLRRRLGSRFRIVDCPRSVCPFVELGNDYEAFVGSLSVKMRAELRRKTRKFERNTDFSVSAGAVTGDARESFDRLFELHNQGFRAKKDGKPDESTFNGEDIRRFHHDVVSGFAARNWLRMYTASSHGTIIGSLYLFSFKGCMFFYQSGFDRRWDHWSIGTVLIGYCIRDCIQQGFKEFHYLRGGEMYKFRWTTAAKQTRRIIVANGTARGLLYAGMAYGRHRLGHLVRKKQSQHAAE